MKTTTKNATLLGGPDCGTELELDWDVMVLPKSGVIYTRTDEVNKNGLRVYRFSYERGQS